MTKKYDIYNNYRVQLAGTTPVYPNICEKDIAVAGVELSDDADKLINILVKQVPFDELRGSDRLTTALVGNSDPSVCLMGLLICDRLNEYRDAMTYQEAMKELLMSLTVRGNMSETISELIYAEGENYLAIEALLQEHGDKPRELSWQASLQVSAVMECFAPCGVIHSCHECNSCSHFCEVCGSWYSNEEPCEFH